MPISVDQTAGLVGTGQALTLLERLSKLAQLGRAILGLTGPPGAGKSTLAEALAADLNNTGIPACWVPMDGFHLADVELRRLGLLEHKGAIETFDGHGYLNLLHRIANGDQETVYAPAFDRRIEQPIAGAIPITPEFQVVITEGNYLLDAVPPWDQIAQVLTETWYCQPSETNRLKWLTQRHITFGKTPEAARRWVAEVDQANADRISATRNRATLIVKISDSNATNERQPS